MLGQTASPSATGQYAPVAAAFSAVLCSWAESQTSRLSYDNGLYAELGDTLLNPNPLSFCLESSADVSVLNATGWNLHQLFWKRKKARDPAPRFKKLWAKPGMQGEKQQTLVRQVAEFYLISNLCHKKDETNPVLCCN